MNVLKKNRDINPGDSDSDSVSDSLSEVVVKPKSHRPRENAFTQQKLTAYEPILTPKKVIPIFLILAVIFIPLGAGMWYGSTQTQEIIIDYEQCANLASSDYYTKIPNRYVDWNFHKKVSITPSWKYGLNASETDPVEQGLCHIQFQIPSDMGSPVFLYYKMKNFYANHRRYVKSFSEDQIKGKRASMHEIKDSVGQNCQPLSHNANGTKYYPCGLIANSLFNDTFTSPVGVNNTEDDYHMTRNGIAWSTDKNRFKKTRYNASEVVPPPNWIKKFPNGYTEENMPDISTWYEFQNWMLPPGFSTFSRLLLRNDTAPMKAGVYEVTVGLHFPVLEFKGKKSVFITTTSVIGAKNSFLGVAWVVAGLICLLLTVIFILIHGLHPRKTGDLSRLSWNREDQGPAVALPIEKEERTII